MQQGTPWKKWNKLYTSLNTLKYAMFSNWFFPASVWQSGGIMRMGDYANVGARQNSSALPSMPLPPPNWSSVQVQHEGQGLHQQPTVDGGPCLLRWVYQKQRRSARWNCGEVTGMFHQSEMLPFERWWRCFIAFNVAGNVMWWNAFSFSLNLLFLETLSIVVKSQWLSLVEQ